jgi:glyoxylase-like metal-dependent hydrolase (beta-lactamase superfamily II)
MSARIERVWTPNVAEHDDIAEADEVNAWVIGDDEEVIVIDHGLDAEAVLEVVGDREVLAVICTHGHHTHVAAAFEVAAAGYEGDEDDDDDNDEEYDPDEDDEDGWEPAYVALHRGDRLQWRLTHDEDPDLDIEPGGKFEVGGVTLDVIHTPGHSAGSVSLYCPELGAVFTGDALHATGPVPHEGDYPDFPRQLNSIGEYLLDLPDKTRVLPWHCDEITIGQAGKRFDGWVSAGPGGE